MPPKSTGKYYPDSRTIETLLSKADGFVGDKTRIRVDENGMATLSWTDPKRRPAPIATYDGTTLTIHWDPLISNLTQHLPYQVTWLGNGTYALADRERRYPMPLVLNMAEKTIAGLDLKHYHKFIVRHMSSLCRIDDIRNLLVALRTNGHSLHEGHAGPAYQSALRLLARQSRLGDTIALIADIIPHIGPPGPSFTEALRERLIKHNPLHDGPIEQCRDQLLRAGFHDLASVAEDRRQLLANRSLPKSCMRAFLAKQQFDRNGFLVDTAHGTCTLSYYGRQIALHSGNTITIRPDSQTDNIAFRELMEALTRQLPSDGTYRLPKFWLATAAWRWCEVAHPYPISIDAKTGKLPRRFPAQPYMDYLHAHADHQLDRTCGTAIALAANGHPIPARLERRICKGILRMLRDETRRLFGHSFENSISAILQLQHMQPKYRQAIVRQIGKIVMRPNAMQDIAYLVPIAATTLVPPALAEGIIRHETRRTAMLIRGGSLNLRKDHIVELIESLCRQPHHRQPGPELAAAIRSVCLSSTSTGELEALAQIATAAGAPQHLMDDIRERHVLAKLTRTSGNGHSA